MESTPSVTGLEYIGEDILNPFERRPRLSHSPVRSTSLNTAPAVGITDPAATEVEKQNEENAFLCLGHLINDLKDIIGSGKRSINQNLRDLVKAIVISYDQVAEEIGKVKPRTKDTKYSQTTPSLGITAQQATKRTYVRAPGEVLPIQGPSRKENEVTKSIVNVSQKTAMPNMEGKKATEGAWITVNKRQGTKSKPARPDAIIVRSTGEYSYA